MALIESTSNVKYLSIIGGKIVQSFKQPVEGAIERVNKVGNTVYEKHYKSIEGNIVHALKREHPEYGVDICIEIQDGDDLYNITLGVASAFCRAFLMKVPNIVWGERYTITPYSFEDKEKGRMVNGLNIYKGSEKIANAYSKENPNGLPELEKKKIKGKETWDDSERIEFLLSTLPSSDTSEKEEDDLDF
jgi:hypothetical protein